MIGTECGGLAPLLEVAAEGLALSSSQQQALRLAAGRLAPLDRGGLELSFDARRPPAIDLHQPFWSRRGEADALARLARQGGDEPWSLVARFAALWSAEHDWLPEAILELEPDGSPLLFLGAAGVAPEQREQRLGSLLCDLGKGAARSVLGQLFAALPAGSEIRHLGLTDSRAAGSVRLNVARIGSAQLEVLLRGIEWPGQPSALVAWATSAERFCDSLTLALDWCDGWSPRLGLECFCATGPGHDARCLRWLGELERSGVVPSGSCQSLAGWPAIIHPANTGAPWPQESILESMRRGAAQLPVVRRAFHHSKLVLEPDGAASAKVYLQFRHQWVRPGRVSA